jgi:hypothetical protein
MGGPFYLGPGRLPVGTGIEGHVQGGGRLARTREAEGMARKRVASGYAEHGKRNQGVASKKVTSGRATVGGRGRREGEWGGGRSLKKQPTGWWAIFALWANFFVWQAVSYIAAS